VRASVESGFSDAKRELLQIEKLLQQSFQEVKEGEAELKGTSNGKSST
jgi:hypothetical protein